MALNGRFSASNWDLYGEGLPEVWMRPRAVSGYMTGIWRVYAKPGRIYRSGVCAEE